MRGTNSGLAVGTLGAPQTSLDQNAYASVVASNEAALNSIMLDKNLIVELCEKNEEASYESIEFITRDELGEIIWLDKGNNKGNRFVGLDYILHGRAVRDGHAKDFLEAFGVLESELIRYLYRAITLGVVVKDEARPIGLGRTGFARVYYYSDRYNAITGIKDNGFIISAYPIEKSVRSKKVLTLRLDFLVGPIWKGVWNTCSKTDITGIPVVDGDEIVAFLDKEIQALYSSFYVFDFDDRVCQIDKERPKETKEKIVVLLERLIQRLDEINDGSFVVDNQLIGFHSIL